MFEDRSSWIGIGVLVLCGLSAGMMLSYIVSGSRPVLDWPAWLQMTIGIGGMILFIGSAFWMRRGPRMGNDVRPTKKHERMDPPSPSGQ